jgi:hypothetical protein
MEGAAAAEECRMRFRLFGNTGRDSRRVERQLHSDQKLHKKKSKGATGHVW